MKKLILTLVVTAMIGLGASSASAAVINFNTLFGPLGITNNTAVMLPQFDPSLGTLTKVTLILDANTSGGSIEWDNEAGIASDVTLGVGATVTATAPSALAAIAVPLQIGMGNVDADNDGAADFIGTDAFSVSSGAGSDTDMAMLANAAFFAPYIGLGNISVTLDSLAQTSVVTSGGFGPINPNPGDYDGEVTVIYEYITNGIPEPASMMLMVSGLALMGMRRKVSKN